MTQTTTETPEITTYIARAGHGFKTHRVMILSSGSHMFFCGISNNNLRTQPMRLAEGTPVTCSRCA